MIIGKIITLIALLLTTFADHKAPQENTTKSRNYSNKSKIKRTKSRINYYANCVAPCNLALPGDIELNPGPGSNAYNNTTKCSLCNKGICTTRKRLQCSQCRNVTVYAWLCSDCTLSTLPFYHSRYLFTTVEISICCYLVTVTTVYPYLKRTPSKTK